MKSGFNIFHTLRFRVLWCPLRSVLKRQKPSYTFLKIVDTVVFFSAHSLKYTPILRNSTGDIWISSRALYSDIQGGEDGWVCDRGDSSPLPLKWLKQIVSFLQVKTFLCREFPNLIYVWVPLSKYMMCLLQCLVTCEGHYI